MTTSISILSDSLQPVLLAVGLGAARTVPLTWLVPALGGPRVSAEIRVGLGLLLAVLCLPILLPAATAGAALGPLTWIVLFARELLVGLTVGLCAGAAFRAAEAAGRLVDILRGANLAEVLSPTSDERTSPTGDLYLFVAVVLFLEMGGMRFFMAALARSYEAVPVSGTVPVTAFRAAAALITATTAKLLESALGLAAPVLVALWVADVTLGVVGRAAPQIPVYFAAMPAKALLGLGMVLVGLGAVDAAWTAGFPAWMSLVEHAFSLWRPR
ncbi:MAG: flagellar biosynthetic protein FliR [Polyangia bacterium]